MCVEVIVCYISVVVWRHSVKYRKVQKSSAATNECWLIFNSAFKHNFKSNDLE